MPSVLKLTCLMHRESRTNEEDLKNDMNSLHNDYIEVRKFYYSALVNNVCLYFKA